MRPLSILIGALGGEGGGVLAQWLVEAAAAAGFPAQSTSIPGVAQRTGATTYYVEVYPERTQRRPVLSLYPVPGRVDLVVSSELLETARIVASGMVSPDRTTLLTSTARTLTTAEKMALGDGRFESDRLLDVARTYSRRLVAFDMESIARETKTVTSAVMFGAVAGSGVLPLERAACEEVIRRDGRGAEASLAGFACGLAATTHESPASQVPATSSEAPTVEGFPPSTQAFAGLGLARVVDFQDRVYGELYLRRLTRVLDFEKRHPAGEYEVTRECARYLALWMAFDDVIRVASLKTKAARFTRVRREVGAGDADVVRIADYFKPGMPEIAGLLPPSWARRLVAWDRARAAKGEPPFGFALTLRTSTIRGFATLRLLAALRGLRPRSARYAEEQRMIESWLDAIVHAPDWESARELALCGRLVKGYGATNERGKRNLLHIVDQLSRRGADAIRDAREAALADEGGKSLDRALAAHGAQPRPVVAQPIRFVRTKAAPR